MWATQGSRQTWQRSRDCTEGIADVPIELAEYSKLHERFSTAKRSNNNQEHSTIDYGPEQTGSVDAVHIKTRLAELQESS